MYNKYKTTDGQYFAYEEDAKEHQQFIDRNAFIDEMIRSKDSN